MTLFLFQISPGFSFFTRLFKLADNSLRDTFCRRCCAYILQEMSPLDASPANRDISKPKSETAGGPEKSASSGTVRSGQSSGKGSPPKAGGEKSG